MGLELPDWPARHEILSTEPLKPFLTPMVSVLETGLYFSQSLRGELVGGITLPEPKTDEIQLGSRLAFLSAMATGMTEVMPRLGAVKVVRQWAGPYDLTPDGNPIVGEAPGVPGFFLCCGFMGHGFMMAPVVARHYAQLLTGGPTHPLLREVAPRPLRRGGDGTREHDHRIERRGRDGATSFRRRGRLRGGGCRSAGPGCRPSSSRPMRSNASRSSSL